MPTTQTIKRSTTRINFLKKPLGSFLRNWIFFILSFIFRKFNHKMKGLKGLSKCALVIFYFGKLWLSKNIHSSGSHSKNVKLIFCSIWREIMRYNCFCNDVLNKILGMTSRQAKLKGKSMSSAQLRQKCRFLNTQRINTKTSKNKIPSMIISNPT